MLLLNVPASRSVKISYAAAVIENPACRIVLAINELDRALLGEALDL